MIIKYQDLGSTDFLFSDIAAYRLSDNIVYDYESQGRVKHLLFYLKGHERIYSFNEKNICMKPGDVLFLPHGLKYKSLVKDKTKISEGIGISFNIMSPKGEEILFDEDVKFLGNDEFGNLYKLFQKIVFSVLNPVKNTLKLKAQMYTLLDKLFKEDESFDEKFSDIIQAINILENNPENNLSTKELADICLMSESTFLRKFKEYSGGVAPVKYRNNIRIMMAEELSASLCASEIAERLGFYDAAHLCKMYKQAKGFTLKNRENA